MEYKKPQATIIQGNVGIYPLTTADQVILADGTRLEKDGKINVDVANSADSAKLGGKAPEYYLQPMNLLDNSDFRNPVNQRGATSVSDQYVYFIDRWITRDSGATYSIDKNGLKIDATNLATNASIRQVLPTTLKDGKYTVAVYRTDGSLKGLRVYNVIDTTLTRIDSVLNDADFYVDLAYSGTKYHVQIMAIAGKAATFGAVSLYEGSYTADTLPPYVPKGYGTELNECRRYFQPNIKVIAMGLNPIWVQVNAFLSPIMRTNPSITICSLKNDTISCDITDAHLEASNIVVYQGRFPNAALTAGTPYVLIFDSSADL